ncbi:MAG: DNA starvation/stationary phase protection protein [Chloroflexota bacterium]
MAVESEPKTVVTILQHQIANAYVLYLNYKRYHWRVFGPLFRDLHLLFDEHAAAILATIDDLGERVRILGADPVATPQAILDWHTVLAPRVGEHTVRTMIDEALANHRRVIAEMREGIEFAMQRGDPGTADLLTRLVQVHEKQEWFLREVVDRAPDGLIREA